MIVIGIILKPRRIYKEKLNDELKEKDPEKATKAYKEYLKDMRFRYIVFFITIILIQGLLWYYASAFCFVYRNSQMGWIQGGIISLCLSVFGFELLVPLLIALVRYSALYFKSKVLYRIKIIPELLKVFKR